MERETESVPAGGLLHRRGEACANGSDLAPAEAALELRRSRTLGYRLIERGELPGTYELPGSNRKRIPRADLEALKERQRVRRAASRPMYEPHMVPAGRPRSASFTAELDAMFGATFSGPHGELFTVLIDRRPHHFVIQVDEPEKGPSFDVAEARAGHVLLSIPRDDDGPLAEVRQFPRGRVVDVSGSEDDNAG